MPLDPELNAHFDEAARINNLDPMLLRALAAAESNFDPNARSGKGAIGLMQFMPDTAKSLGIDPSDPVQAIYGAAQHLNDRLTFHEAQKERNPNIAPIDEALRDYFAGAGGGNRGPETAAYPGRIAQRYAELSGGGAKPQGIDALADVQPQLDVPGRQAFVGSKFVGMVPQPAWQPGMPLDPNSVPRNIGIEALAGMAQPTPWQPSMPLDPKTLAGPSQPAPGGDGQSAQAIPSDEELLRMTNELLPAPKVAGTGAAAAPQTPSASGASSQVFGPEQIVNFLNQAPKVMGGMASIPSLVSDLQKMLPQGSRLTQGPDGHYRIEAITGSNQVVQDTAAAKAEGEQGPVRTSEALKPREQRGAGSSTTFPPGSPGAQLWIDAAAAGKSTPPGVRINDNGSVEVGNINVPPEVVHQRYAELGKLADEANQSRLGLYEAQNLKQKLHAIGTAGPLTEQLGNLAALAKQVGVPDSTISALNIPAAHTIEEAKKLSIDLLGSILHATFPQRITNTDITAWKGTVPQATSMLEANDFLLDKIIVPKFQRSIDRYGHASTLSTDDPQLTTYYKAMNDWDNAHPFDAYAIAKEFKPGTGGTSEVAPNAGGATKEPTATNPTTGEKIILRNGKWVPQ